MAAVKIRTFDELVQSGLMYGYFEGTEIFLNVSMYHERTKIRSPRFYCSEHNECLERLIRHGDITMISVPIVADYDALKIIPTYKKKNQVCFLDEDVHKMLLVMYMQAGNPLLHRANTIIRRTIEAGLVDNYWSMMKWRFRVNNVANSTYDDGLTGDNQYFALKLSHLHIAFIVLSVGYILSSVIFIAELLCALISTRGK